MKTPDLGLYRVKKRFWTWDYAFAVDDLLLITHCVYVPAKSPPLSQVSSFEVEFLAPDGIMRSRSFGESGFPDFLEKVEISRE